jgi:hypothetical protein
MPPIENELAEDDFNAAIVWGLYLREQKRAREDMKEQAYMNAIARLGGTLDRDGE